MTRNGATICPISAAHLTGIASIKLAVIAAFFRLEFAAIPLAGFILLCGAASLIPRSRFFLPVISRGHSGKKAVAITFDDGPDPLTTPLLLDMLSKHSVRAAFFITGIRAARYPDIVRDIISKGHDIGNHSYSHNPLLMFKRSSDLYSEIASTQKILASFDVTTCVFRPPVGVTNPKLWRALLRLGLVCVTFSRRAGDFGNRRISGMAQRILNGLRPDDIIMLHDVMPSRGMDRDAWLGEVERILTGIRQKGLDILSLSEIISRTVMTAGKPDAASGPVTSFYDGLADSYDHEQFKTGVSLAKRRECEIVSANLFRLLKSSDRILEIGAGTGIFTLPMAQRCREITAVDLSPAMISVLRAKAEAANADNIRCIVGDITKRNDLSGFDVICSFSSFEYIADLPAFVKHLAPLLKPGGLFYFTTSHRSFFRFFTQLGNAMRQGLWLHARSKAEIAGILKSAGFHAERVSDYLFKSLISGGMILEVEGRKADHDVL